MDQPFYVTLTGPAKVNGVREPAGKSVPVTMTLALQLAAAGVINPDLPPVPSASTVDAAALIGERDAHWSTALDHFETMALDREAAAIASLQADHLAQAKALEKRAADAEKEAGELRAKVAELEAAIANTQAAKGAQKKA